MKCRGAIILFSVALVGLLAQGAALAHPMGNFSINHYARLEVRAERVSLRYILDMAEIPTVSERSAMDADGNGKISGKEQENYLYAKALQLRDGLTLTQNRVRLPLEIRSSALAFRPGAGGLDTLRLTFELIAARPKTSSAAACQIAYQDANFAERTGWKEIVAVAGSGLRLADSSVSAEDRSQELNVYPTDTGAISPQQTSATFAVVAGNAPAEPIGAPILGRASPRTAEATTRNRTPQDAFTQSIAGRDLAGGAMALALGIAFLMGALHALSPGHGKAMVAAYLVGSQGTPRHALFLGGVVTLTHTIGVFALGILTLTATHYIVPERLYPVLSALSGIAVVGIGLALLRQRLRILRRARPQDLYADDFEDVGAEGVEMPPLPADAPLSFKTLLLLGITGGALPCPSALVVMLSAIALHRVGFGLALITAFSLGLAAVLTGIGLLVVRAREFMMRLPMNGRLVSQLPVVSAALVTLIGLVLILKAATGKY
jgi:nickel/cobalt exporter